MNCVAAGLQSGLVRLQLLRDVAGLPASPVSALAFSLDSQLLVVAGRDGQIT